MFKLTKLPRDYLIGIIATILLLYLPVQDFIPVKFSLIEAIAIITSAWSVWLLSKNNLWGWWIGLVGVIAYIFVFFEVKLYGEVGIQIFYLITSCQAIYIWLKGGENKTEKPIERISPRLMTISIIGGIVGILGLWSGLIALGGAAPFWDSVTTIGSLIAQLLLMERYVESWYIWIGVDTIYVPLYASRGLYFTSFLYAVFWLMAVSGLRNFRKIYRQQQRSP